MSGNKTAPPAVPEAKGKSEARKERVPLGAPRLKMAVKGGTPGHRQRWVNDVGDRLTQAMDGGYNFVPREGAEFTQADVANRNESVNNAISKVVDKELGTKAYLMEIPEGWYVADQLEKQKHIDETEDALRQGSDAHGKPGINGRYIPREGIKIS